MNHNRREFIKTSGAAALSVAAGSHLFAQGPEAKHIVATKPISPNPLLKGKAKSCILIWLGGGASQIDTFDPKKKGDPAAHVAGSAYESIDTAVPGVQVSEYLPGMAKRLDRMTLLRTLHHEVVDEHGAATNRMHTGRPVSGTVIYPSIGSVINHELQPDDTGIPGYVLCGYPSLSRGAGFLGAKYSYLYITDTDKGPTGLAMIAGMTRKRQKRRYDLLKQMRLHGMKRFSDDDPIGQYEQIIEKSEKLATGEFRKVFDLENESAHLRNSYGGEFGQRCLLARRLVESGTRYVEVMHNLNFINGTGWDTHKEGQLKQHILIQELDQALAALIDDLEQKNKLDETLIVVATEFGRPAAFDGLGGRGHQSSVFSAVVAGGGLNHLGAWGQTDEMSKTPVADPQSVPDFHATIYAALGIDYTKELYAGDRPIPITDGGNPIAPLF